MKEVGEEELEEERGKYLCYNICVINSRWGDELGWLFEGEG